ncbi:hypothetical protein RSK20926_22069 [Roseobacter sp. SK209-2-6]|nr:hypothetical protein RSK20926_22069 [Roseobacter sp. SK209-2-6]
MGLIGPGIDVLAPALRASNGGQEAGQSKFYAVGQKEQRKKQRVRANMEVFLKER